MDLGFRDILLVHRSRLVNFIDCFCAEELVMKYGEGVGGWGKIRGWVTFFIKPMKTGWVNVFMCLGAPPLPLCDFMTCPSEVNCFITNDYELCFHGNYYEPLDEGECY